MWKLHHPVLLEPVLEFVSLAREGPSVVIDATLWPWWHSYEILDRLPPGSIWIGIDRDSENLAKARELLEPKLSKRNITWHFVHSSFADIDGICAKLDIDQAHFFLYDLWVSSVHLDEGGRGFSFRSDALLDMRFDRTTGSTAADIVNRYDTYRLRKIFSDYAEEPKAHFIALAIEKQRKNAPIRTTEELASIIRASSFDPKSTLRVFQALRIETNDEFSHIERSLHQAIERLSPRGRIAVITFHSLEDRLVKQIFTPFLKPVVDDITGKTLTPAQLQKVTKKPIEPTEQEIQDNPRSRSAKLRIVEKVVHST